MNQSVRALSMSCCCFALFLACTADDRPGAVTGPPESRPSSPYVEVLGIAQDGGLPHAGCTCERCLTAIRDPVSKQHVASLALILPTDDRVYLFDATPDIREQLAMLYDLYPSLPGRVDRQPIAGVFLTHAHIGHYLGLAFFGYEAIHTSSLPVFASHRMAEYLRQNGPWSQLVDLQNIVLEELVPGTPRQLGEGVTVTPIRSPHRDEYADTLGFLMVGPRRSLFYLPDTDSWIAWDAPVTDLLDTVDIALLDGTFFSLGELPGRRVEEIGHPLITSTMELLQSLVEEERLEVFFTHLNHTNPALDRHGDARRAIESRGFAVLEEGQKIPL